MTEETLTYRRPVKTEADGYRAGFASGESVPRGPDDFDYVHAWNVGGANYQRGFILGLKAGSEPKTPQEG
jgi:hypothetical protein